MTEGREKSIRTWAAAAFAVVSLSFIAWQGGIMTDSRDEQLSAEKARTTAERERDMQLRRAELIIISAPVAIILCGEDRIIRICNPKAEEMFGWTQDELIGQSINIMLPKSTHEAHTVAFNKAVAVAKAGPDNQMLRRVGVLAPGVHKDGHIIDLDVSIRVIKYGGEIEFITSMRIPKEKPHTDVLPLPNMSERRHAVQQRYSKK